MNEQELRESLEDIWNTNDCNCEVRVSQPDGSSFITTSHMLAIDDAIRLIQAHTATVAAEARKEQIMQDFFAYSEEIDDSEDKFIEVRDDLLAALNSTQPEKEKKD